jgi:hypothetical protein
MIEAFKATWYSFYYIDVDQFKQPIIMQAYVVSGLVAGITWMSLDFLMVYFITISVNRFLKIIELENIKNSKGIVLMRFSAWVVRILIGVTSVSYNVTPFVL